MNSPIVTHLRTFVVTGAALVLATVGVAVSQTQVPSWPREAENAMAPKPPKPSAAARVLVGEYESPSAAPGGPVHLYVLENDAKLWTIADRGEPKVLVELGGSARVVKKPDGSVAAIELDGIMYNRLQVGPEGGGQLRVSPIRNVAEVLKESATVSPPAETGTFKPADLVELTTLDPTIKLDIRYATTNNFLGSVFYSQARAFAQRSAAEAAVRAHKALKPFGYGLLIHDGYRPWSVTRTFWECTPLEKKWLVANPASGSKHNRGAAIDLTLYDLSTGAVVEMPSTYDESTPRAYAFYPGGTGLQRWHRALLRRLMEAEGFTVNPEEWWHFDYKDWKSYAIGNVPFDRLK
jgi:D-alanyl-D-alanine dipeptidase